MAVNHRTRIKRAAERRQKLYARAKALTNQGNRELVDAVDAARGSITVTEAAELVGMNRVTLSKLLSQVHRDRAD